MMDILKRFKDYMQGRTSLLPISLILSALSGVLSLLPYFFIWLIIRTLLSGSVEYTHVMRYALWALATAVGSLVCYFASGMLSHLAAFRVEVNMRRRAMHSLLALPLGFFDGQSGGRIRKVIDENASETHTFIAHILPDLVGSILAPVLVFILIFVFDWRLGLACLIPILLAFLTIATMMKAETNTFQKQYLAALEVISGEAVEYVRGIPVVKVFQQTVYSFKRFYNSIINYRDLVTQYTKSLRVRMQLYQTFIHALPFFLVPTAMLIIHHGGDYGGTISDTLLYILITPILTGSVMKIMNLQYSLYNAGQAIDRMESLTQGTEPLSYPKVTSLPKQHDLRFEHVSFRYPGASEDTLRDISFHIPEGKTFALVGPSGGGKTTIARLVPRFWDVAGGTISIGGVDVRDMAKTELMREVSFAFQDARLFKTTLRDNIVYGSTHATEGDIHRVLRLAQCQSFVEQLPKGLQTQIGGKDGVYLSGGELQRIALARVLVKDAPIVILDEATAFADPENEALIQQALVELMRGKTALMIAHRLTTIQHVDHILVIDKGCIAEQGTHDELLAQGGLYAHMWAEYHKAVAWNI